MDNTCAILGLTNTWRYLLFFIAVMGLRTLTRDFSRVDNSADLCLLHLNVVMPVRSDRMRLRIVFMQRQMGEGWGMREGQVYSPQ